MARQDNFMNKSSIILMENCVPKTKSADILSRGEYYAPVVIDCGGAG